MNDNKTPYRKKYAVELKHYGVEGMKWGVRKDRNPTADDVFSLGRQLAKDGRGIANIRRDYEHHAFGDHPNANRHDELEYEREHEDAIASKLPQMQRTLDTLLERAFGYEESNPNPHPIYDRSASREGKDPWREWEDRSERRVAKLMDATTSVGKMSAALQDITVPSRELYRLCDETERYFTELSREYEDD